MAGKTSTTPRTTTAHAPATSRGTSADTTNAVTLQPAETGHDAIRARAFFLWEQAGHPESDGVEFWLRAEQELVAPR